MTTQVSDADADADADAVLRPGPTDLVEDLRAKLRAAEGREQQLHHHLIFHLQEKDALLNQVAELRRTCETLLHAQARAMGAFNVQAQSNMEPEARPPADGPFEASPGVAETGAGEGTVRGDPSPPQCASLKVPALPSKTNSAGGFHNGQRPLSERPEGARESGSAPTKGGADPGAGAAPRPSSSLKAIMDAAGVSPSRPTEPAPSSAFEGGAAVAESSTPVNANGWSGGGQSGPATNIPQLLREQGGHIRVTDLWEAYQDRFGVTRYAVKDLFAMITTGTIPGVVHEPPNGIRLLPPAQLQWTQRLPQLPTPSVTPPLPPQQQQQQQQQQQSRMTIRAVSLYRKQSPSFPAAAATATAATSAGATPIPAEGVAAQNVEADGGWDNDTSPDHAVRAEARSTTGEQRENDADSRGESAGNDASPGGWGEAGSGNSAERVKRKLDWRELKHNVNFLLKEEGPLNARELNNCFMKRYRKPPFLDGVPLRFAVAAGWIKGVCFDVRSKKYNLVVRVPENFREAPPDGAPSSPPGQQHQRPSSLRPSSPGATEPNWRQISEEFRSLLSEGMLDPNELHAQYRKQFKKPLSLPGSTIRAAVSSGCVEGVAIDSETLRLKLA